MIYHITIILLRVVCAAMPAVCSGIFYSGVGLSLNDQPQGVHAPPVLPPRRNDINARGVDAAVPQNIRQAGNILICGIEEPRKQVAQIVGKDFACIHPGGEA